MVASRRHQILFIGATTILVATMTSIVSAAGGTSIVASKGRPAATSAAWPEGVSDIVNDPRRTKGWNSWFSEWPNDVNQYAFDIKSTEDLNALIAKLAAVKTQLKQIRLSHLKEPQALGWVTVVPAGNKISVIFSIGDQARIDQWYKHVRKPFGQMEFVAAPIAVPPTLTIFVQNEVVDLDKLSIPKGITVEAGYVPTVFHKSNTTREKEQEAEAAKRPKVLRVETNTENLDDATRKAVEKIHEFANRHAAKELEGN